MAANPSEVLQELAGGPKSSPSLETLVITDPLVTKLVGTRSCQKASWERDGWHLLGAASAEKRLGSDWEVPLLGTQILGVPQPLSSAQMLPAPASPSPSSLLTGLSTNTPSCKGTHSQEAAGYPMETASHVCPTWPQRPWWGRKGAVFLQEMMRK